MTEHEDPELVTLRHQMDGVNERLFELLEERVRLAADIARRKQVLALPSFDPERENTEVAAARATRGELDPDARERILRIVLDETRRAQGRR